MKSPPSTESESPFWDHAGWLGSRWHQFSFECRAGGLRLRRGIQNAAEFHAPLRRASRSVGIDETVLGESRSILWNSLTSAEWKLTAGKVENLRRAIASLQGLTLEPGELFSFWRQVGRPSRRRGFVEGRELREGCLIASVGGGLCQLSNALYAAALDARLQIVERHPHSQTVPGSQAAQGRDATVFWNYLDLRFRAAAPLRIDASLTPAELIVRLISRRKETLPGILDDGGDIAISPVTQKSEPPIDCITCRHEECVHHGIRVAGKGRSAFLLDVACPEFAAWTAHHARPGDVLLLPLDGARRGKASYAWFAGRRDLKIIEHGWTTLQRSWTSRRLATQGAARQKALLHLDALLAERYARHLPHDADELVVSLNLLPHLSRLGVLGGRSVTVLLNRSPLQLLHQQLDGLSQLHPGSTTANDFRVDSEWVERESEALAEAALRVTPHRMVARFLESRFAGAVELLPWKIPQAEPIRTSGSDILFPASSLARKGAFEIRQAARAGSWRIRVLGKGVESPDFWKENETVAADPARPFEGVGRVVLPAFVEHQPRLLLRAIAAGLPVVCTEACGLGSDLPGVTVVPSGDAEALIKAMASPAARTDAASS